MKTSKIIILVGCAVGGVLFLIAGFMLYRGIDRFYTSKAELEKVKGDLSRYYKAPIFPSIENVKQELENARQVDAWFDGLMATLCEGNVNSDERSPSKFIGISEVVRKRLVSEGQKAGTELPTPAQSFAFGFDRYSGTGALPKPQDVPRLMEQLVIINRLSLVMFKNRVKSISSITRDTFEDAPSKDNTAAEESHSRRRGGRRGDDTPSTVNSQKKAGIIGENALFAKLHFVFEFRAKESALVSILNALSAHPMFIVVTSLSVSKPSPELVPTLVIPDADRTALSEFGETHAAEATAPPSNLGPNFPICGIKMEIPMDVRLELDVYKFREVDVDSGD